MALRSFIIAFCLCLVTNILIAAESNDQNRGELRDRVEPKGWLYGFGLGINGEIYKGYDRRVIPLPLIGYRGDKLLVLGPFANYELFEAGNFDFTINVAPRFAGFDEGDSIFFTGMEKRKSTLDMGLGLVYENDNWKFQSKVLYDILGRSDGYEVTAQVGKVFRTGPVFIEPTVGVSYMDDNLVDYYYGVRDNEANAIRPAYQGKDVLNTTLGISFATPILFGGFTRAGIEYTWFDSGITDSPLVNDDSSLGVFIAYSRFFK